MKAKISTYNPRNGEKLQDYEYISSQQLDALLLSLKEKQLAWKNTELPLRAHALKKLSALLLENKERYAQVIHVEMGKKISEAMAEVEKCAHCADYYAENAAEFLADSLVITDAKKSYITYQPLGTLLAIMPWNFPFWQAFRAAIPAILAGNFVILKHASNVSGCALEIEKIFSHCFPTPVLATILLDGKSTQELIRRNEISAVTFTGSTIIGKLIAATAGEYLKKSVFELGGSDPYLILADADLEKAAKICAYSRLINAGQSCISAKRMIVHKSIRAEFEGLLQKEMLASEIAPMARSDLRDELHKQVKKSIQAGASLLCGGKIPDGSGYFYPATILSNIKPGMPAFEEELFGPVASIIEAGNEEEAIDIANSLSFGLGAAIFSKNRERAEAMAKSRIEAGSVFVNNFVRSDSRLPFGGIKESGYGRELSLYGLREFTNIKTVWID